MRIEIDDKQILDFAKKSPARAEWAMREALKMCGGHFRKKLREYVETGGPGNWKPISEITKTIKRRTGQVIHSTPLFELGKFAMFKYGKSKGVPRVWIGFSGKIIKIARAVQIEKKTRVTPQKREFLARHGIFLRKTTKFITSPARPIIEPFWRREQKNIAGYVEKRFFEKFFSKQKPKIEM